jgi:replicative DNA helicase
MNNEKRLLSKALLDRDLTPLFDRNVSASWFSDDNDKKIWVFVREHFSRYGECPSLEIVKDNYPSFVTVEVSDSVDYLLDSLASARRRVTTANLLREAIEKIDRENDHDGALRVLQAGVLSMDANGLSETNDVDITEDKELDRRWERYQKRKEIPDGLLGYPTGFPTIDKVTNGLQPEQLIVITATPKTGKSTLAMQMAINIHVKPGVTPMFWSFEMSNREQEDRYDAMRARVSYQRLITGTLTSNDEEPRYKRLVVERMREDEHKFWVVDSSSGATLSQVSSKLQTYQPSILFIDGMYLMIDEQTGESNTPQALTNLTRGFKRMAQKFRIPIVITTQSLDWKKGKGGRLTANSIGYSSSFYQDADVIFGLEKPEESVDETRILSILASRNSGPGSVHLAWGWDEGTFREMSGDLDA